MDFAPGSVPDRARAGASCRCRTGDAGCFSNPYNGGCGRETRPGGVVTPAGRVQRSRGLSPVSCAVPALREGKQRMRETLLARIPVERHRSSTRFCRSPCGHARSAARRSVLLLSSFMMKGRPAPGIAWERGSRGDRDGTEDVGRKDDFARCHLRRNPRQGSEEVSGVWAGRSPCPFVLHPIGLGESERRVGSANRQNGGAMVQKLMCLSSGRPHSAQGWSADPQPCSFSDGGAPVPPCDPGETGTDALLRFFDRGASVPRCGNRQIVAPALFRPCFTMTMSP